MFKWSTIIAGIFIVHGMHAQTPPPDAQVYDEAWLTALRTADPGQTVTMSGPLLIIGADTTQFPAMPPMGDTVRYSAMADDMAYHLYCYRNAYSGLWFSIVREIAFGEEVQIVSAYATVSTTFYMGMEIEEDPSSGVSVPVDEYSTVHTAQSNPLLSGRWINIRCTIDPDDKGKYAACIVHGSDMGASILPFPDRTFFYSD